MKVYLNGNLVKSESIEDLLEPGFLFGWGVFETVRVYKGKPAFLDEHLCRLKFGCTKVLIKFPEVDFAQEIKKLLLANSLLEDAYCRITLFKKRKSTGVSIYVSAFAYYTAKDYQKGFKAILAPFQRNSSYPLIGVKATSYLENRLAWAYAQKEKKDEAIFLNQDGFLAEGSRTNVFFVKEKKIFTPSLKCGLLAGITREKVIKAIKQLGLVLKEGKFSLEDLKKAEEAFLTSSLMEVMPLVEMDGKKIGLGSAGRVTLNILEKYRKLI